MGDEANPSAAKSRLMQAKMMLDRAGVKEPDEVEAKLQEGEKFLNGVHDAATEPIWKEIGEVRGQLGPLYQQKYAKALRFAKEAVEKGTALRAQGMERDVEDKLQEAEKLLKDVPEGFKAEVAAEIAAVRAGAGGGGATKPAVPAVSAVSAGGSAAVPAASAIPTPARATTPIPASGAAVPASVAAAAAATPAIPEKTRALMDQMARDIRQAESDLGWSPRNAEDDLKRARNRLNSPEGKAAFDAATVEKYQAQMAAVQEKLTASVVKDSLLRAKSPLEELEEKLKGEPFAGLDQMQAHRVAVDLDSLAGRVRGAIDALPKEHAEVKAVRDRLQGLEEKIAAGSASWGKQLEVAKLKASWKFDQQAFAGWEEETPSGGGTFKPWLMTQTGKAIKYAAMWLENKEMQELVERHKDEAEVKATVAEVAKTREAAGVKLNAAYNRVLEEAEKMPLPGRAADRTAAENMALEAGRWFGDTPYKEANVARAAKLDEKWRSEYAAIEKEAAGALERMMAEAQAAWPGIVAGIPAREGFNPAEAANLKGQTVRLKGVRNRAGWDFDGQYDFAMWIGQNPLAGSYQPQVAAAMQEAARQIRRSVDDHIDWEVIAVVEGPGTINKRVFTEVIDQRTRDVLGKIESYHPIDCTRLRIVALHAGPVAVGPK